MRVFTLQFAAVTQLLICGCQSPGLLTRLFSERGSSQQAFATRPPSPAADAAKPDPQSLAQNKWKTGADAGDKSISLELSAARMAQENGQLNQAQMSYQRILQLQPDHAEAHQGLAVIFDQQGNYQQAEQHYLQALRIAPRDPDLLSNLGYSYFLQGRLPEAQTQLQAALSLQPQHRTALYNLGAVYARQGQGELALSILRRAGDEQSAQAALAQFSPPRNAADPDSRMAGLPSAPPDNMSPATRKIWEQMQQERQAFLQQQPQKQSPQRPPYMAAPQHGRNELSQYSGPAVPSHSRDPRSLNQLFDEIDRQAARDQAISELASTREGRYTAASQSPGYPAQGQTPPDAFVPARPVAIAPVVAQQTTATPADWNTLNSQTQLNAASPVNSQYTGNRGGGVPAHMVARHPSAAEHPAELPQWTQAPLAQDGTFPGGERAVTNQNSYLANTPRIQSKNGTAVPWGNSASNSPCETNAPATWPQNMLPENSSLPQWPGNALPAGTPQGRGATDEFVPLSGHGTPPRLQSSSSSPAPAVTPRSAAPLAQPQYPSGVVPAGGTQQPGARPWVTPASANSNAWEEASREAAQMGLNAGPGNMFPVNSQNLGGTNPQGDPGRNTSDPRANSSRSVPPPRSDDLGQNGISHITQYAPQWPQGGPATTGSRQGTALATSQMDNRNWQLNSRQWQSGQSPGVPTSQVPSAQGASYGNTQPAASNQEFLLRSSATESGRQQALYQQAVQSEYAPRTENAAVGARADAPNSGLGPQTNYAPQNLSPGNFLPADGGFPTRH